MDRRESCPQIEITEDHGAPDTPFQPRRIGANFVSRGELRKTGLIESPTNESTHPTAPPLRAANPRCNYALLGAHQRRQAFPLYLESANACILPASPVCHYRARSRSRAQSPILFLDRERKSTDGHRRLARKTESSSSNRLRSQTDTRTVSVTLSQQSCCWQACRSSAFPFCSAIQAFGSLRGIIRLGC